MTFRGVLGSSADGAGRSSRSVIALSCARLRFDENKDCPTIQQYYKREPCGYRDLGRVPLTVVAMTVLDPPEAGSAVDASSVDFLARARRQETSRTEWVADAVREEIVEGRLRPGSRLPGATDLHGAGRLPQHGARGDEPTRRRAGARARAAPRPVRGATGPRGHPRRLPARRVIEPGAVRAGGRGGRDAARGRPRCGRGGARRGGARAGGTTWRARTSTSTGRWWPWPAALGSTSRWPCSWRRCAWCSTACRACASSTSPTSAATPASASFSRPGKRIAAADAVVEYLREAEEHLLADYPD